MFYTIQRILFLVRMLEMYFFKCYFKRLKTLTNFQHQISNIELIVLVVLVCFYGSNFIADCVRRDLQSLYYKRPLPPKATHADDSAVQQEYTNAMKCHLDEHELPRGHAILQYTAEALSYASALGGIRRSKGVA